MFIHADFLLGTRTARRLYHEFAEPEPIFDYHCHLSPQALAGDRRFHDLSEIWLEGDHYKWRAMRANGVPERFCTGNGTPLEKFKAWAATVPQTLRNPLYHWTHLELSRHFGITELLNADNAERIWAQANEQLATPEFSVHGILRKFQVKALCTTDDPADDLHAHAAMTGSGLDTTVRPTFRPDAALTVNRPALFQAWLARLEKVCDRELPTLPALLAALQQRCGDFHAHGCRLSDHGLERCYPEPCTEAEASAIFTAARAGQAAAPPDHAKFASFLLHFLGGVYARLGWTMQLHLGALRDNNTRLRRALGPDTGFDSIGDFPQAAALSAYLDRLDAENALPRTILYNLNPADNATFAAMAGNFQDDTVPGKVQLGAAWWFLDQKDGIEQQLNALSNFGLLARFVGMVTDSRSFLSYPRHEYFRRVLCNLLGREIESGELPDDDGLVGALVRNVCYRNAVQFLRLPTKSAVDPCLLSS